jgi:hypothetical protein
MRLRFILTIAGVTTAAACASLPEVTFEDPDAATDASGAGSSDATAGDSGGTVTDGAGGNDTGTAITDAGNTNDGSVSTTPDAAACGGSTGDICCGAQICHNCVLADCPSCTGLACTAGKVCCAKSMSVTCHAPGLGC